MKTLHKPNSHLIVCAVLFLLCCGGAMILRSCRFFGQRYFYATALAFAAGILFGAVLIILSVFRLRKTKQSIAGILCLTAAVLLMPLMVFASRDCLRDLIQGCTEIQTEIYKLPVGGWQTDPDGEPVGMEFSVPDHGFYRLPVSEEMYSELTEKNPVDETRTVYDAEYDENVHPHLHPVL